MSKKNKIREGNPIATGIMYILAAFVVLITLYPMYYVLILSLSDPRYAITLQVYAFPKGFNLDAYKVLTLDPKIWRSFANTVLYAVSGMLLMLITSILGAFPLTYKSLIGRKYVNTYLLITMFFSGGLIPSFLLILRLGIYDTPLALIIPGCFSVWNIILVKSYFSTVPETLREAAKIDGANVYQILLKVYLPLSTPILAVIAVYTVVGIWNSWFSALVYLPHVDWQPLQLYLRRMLIQAQSPTEVMNAEAARELAARQLSYAQLKYAMIIFSSLPVLFTYPFFQKYFMKGIMLGSLKE
ncbi:MAG: carbohydrate ABC transporter permease [Treponema sp.]|jgi:putative aldouronate transport system permease protein|nr:carbohydrate ABC transporter permease [Treponema sp.]